MDTLAVPAASSAPPPPLEVQRELARFNERRLRPTIGDAAWVDQLDDEVRLRRVEEAWIAAELAAVAERAATAPTDEDGFIAWFCDLRRTGPGQHDSLFPYLEHHATMPQMLWFLTQEVAGEAGFDDLVALAQVKMPTAPKLELARNYWDEMGRGGEAGMHGPMLGRLADALAIDTAAEPIPQALSLNNLMVALAANRRYAYHALGALGVIELTAPDRARAVNLGLKRLGVGPHERQYYALHATVDEQHSVAWNAEVFRPLVRARPELARPFAEGALMRLRAGERCFVRYRHELGLGAAA